MTFGAYTDPQSLTTGYQNDQLRPAFRLTAKLVGVGTTGWAGVVEDQQDASSSAVVLFTPALTRRLLNCCASLTIVGLTLSDGTRSEAAVQAELARVLPKGVPSGAGTTLSVVSARAERTIRPESQLWASSVLSPAWPCSLSRDKSSGGACGPRPTTWR